MRYMERRKATATKTLALKIGQVKYVPASTERLGSHMIDHVTSLRIGQWTYEVRVKTPRSTNLAPPGYYMVFVVNQDIPSEGIWVRLQ